MNQCTDVLLLHLVPPQRIASISFVTGQRPWTPPTLAPVVADLPRNRGLAEEVLPLKPDLVVTGAFSGGRAVQVLKRLGYQVEVFVPETSLAEARANILRMGALVGEEARAAELVADLDARLARIAPSAGPRPLFADVGVNGWMSGEGTLMADLAAAAGIETLGQRRKDPGYRFRSLEEVVAARPDILAFINAWSGTEALGSMAFRHPAYRRLEADGAVVVDLPERLIACASPDLAEAAERLARARGPGRTQ
jgi:iron complex transport system substrate-binding protein